MNVAYDNLVDSLVAECTPRRQSNLVTGSSGIERHQALDEIMGGVSDLSVGSPELLSAALASGAWYEFTPCRTGIVRAFDFPAKCRVLEIGAGAGTLTRYLGEHGARVVALEESPDLYRVARERCSGLGNVTVIRGALDSFTHEEPFDFVICVDPLLSTADRIDPVRFLLSRARAVLKATGTLILAVANPLRSYAGLTVSDAHTHVRGVRLPLDPLRELMTHSGFRRIDTYMAFPHCAAPLLVVEPQASKRLGVNWVARVPETYQTTSHTAAELEAWWRGVVEQGLELHMAPGWIICAHAHRVHYELCKGWGAKHFAMSEKVPSLCDAQGSQVGEVAIECGDRDIAMVAQCASKPVVSSLTEYKRALDLAHERIEELSSRESDISQSYGRNEENLRSEIKKAWDDGFEKEREADCLRERCATLQAELSVQCERVKRLLDLTNELAEKNLALMEESIVRTQTSTEAPRAASSNRGGLLKRIRFWFKS